jgi:putative heme iron utilization protein
MNKESIDKATALIKSKQDGVLATLSVKLEGFPFGSVVPYCLDHAGWPVILISTIAEHTKNIMADNRCSLTIVMDSEDVQANGRICIVGHMKKLLSEEKEIMERYYVEFPNSRSYDATHDFSFYRLTPVSIRYIGGFGQIHWFKPEEFKS